MTLDKPKAISSLLMLTQTFLATNSFSNLLLAAKLFSLVLLRKLVALA